METTNFDEWIESVAADRGIGVVPEVAMRRNIHPAVRFIPLPDAPPSPVALVFRPHVHETMLRHFVDISLTSAGAHS
ncbi:LysR substrate-binding domain-containing protein [Amycolatopsis sp. TRM77291]